MELYSHEGGKHVFVRIPPTERNGRTQTSVVTVASMSETEFVVENCFNKNDVDKTYTTPQGNGGQKANKTSSVVQLIHKPTGIVVKVQDTRHRHKNEEIAWERLKEKVQSIYKDKAVNDYKNAVKEQIGNGGRSDKKRTYRVKENLVVDHITGKSARFSDVIKGKIDLLK